MDDIVAHPIYCSHSIFQLYLNIQIIQISVTKWPGNFCILLWCLTIYGGVSSIFNDGVIGYGNCNVYVARSHRHINPSLWMSSSIYCRADISSRIFPGYSFQIQFKWCGLTMKVEMISWSWMKLNYIDRLTQLWLPLTPDHATSTVLASVWGIWLGNLWLNFRFH